MGRANGGHNSPPSRALYIMDNYRQLFNLIKFLYINPTPVPGRCSVRERVATRFLWSGFAVSSAFVDLLKSRSKIKTLIRKVTHDITLDATITLVKAKRPTYLSAAPDVFQYKVSTD